jgi:hypothetical protein
MLNLSIGILSWHSTDVLINTLKSYHDNGLLDDISDDIVIFFQEFTPADKEIADHFNIKYIASKENVGIGQAFLKLASGAKHDHILLLEHDWQLVTESTILEERLASGLKLLEMGYDCIRYRHRKMPGHPHFSEKNYSTPERALAYHDPEIDLSSPHLLDSIHWIQNPVASFPGKIGIQQLVDSSEKYFVTTSRFGNWTNNPCMYNKKFYVQAVKQFAGKGIELEGKISHWWARQNFNVAHGEGLFKHDDFVKFP